MQRKCAPQNSRAASGSHGGIHFDAAVVVALVPLAQVIVAEAIGQSLVREQCDDTALRFAFGAWLFRHGNLSVCHRC